MDLSGVSKGSNVSGESQKASVSSESSAQQSPVSTPSGSSRHVYQKGYNRKGSAKQRGNFGKGNDDEKSSDDSGTQRHRYEELQDQMNALFGDFQSGFNAHEGAIADLRDDFSHFAKTTSESVAEFKESNASVKASMESLTHFVQIIAQSLDKGVAKNESVVGDSSDKASVENREFIVPVLGAQPQQGQTDHTVLDGAVEMSDLMRMGSHDRSRFNPRDNFSAFSTIKKVNFTSPDEVDDLKEFAERKAAKASKGTRVAGCSRAPSIEQLPKVQYESPHPLHHPYIHSAMFPTSSLEIVQAPDWLKLGLVLESEQPLEVSAWMRKISQTQSLFLGVQSQFGLC